MTFILQPWQLPLLILAGQQHSLVHLGPSRLGQSGDHFGGTVAVAEKELE
ncbi:MAG TPA: hypothetical protein VKI17_07795 [Gemmataceae bacterium]|nr:hypothetical protein [Gemmataceae bacterium]